jgi:hypothetical protein
MRSSLEGEVEHLESELLCFHSRKTYLEDVLGFGLNVEKRANRIVEVCVRVCVYIYVCGV